MKERKQMDQTKENQTFTMCFVGRSGSGKSTLSQALAKELIRQGTKIQILDGDEQRKKLGNMFGYSKEERIKQSRVNSLVAHYLNLNEVNVLLSMVGAYEDMRSGLREFLGSHYIEVYVKCSSKECERRDVKGYYQKFKEGKMQNLNGVDDLFEEPQHSEIVIDTEELSLDQGVQLLLDYLRKENNI